MVWVRDPCFVLSLSQVAVLCLCIEASGQNVGVNQSPDVSHIDIPNRIDLPLYSAGPATGQIGPGSPRPSSVPEQMLSWHQKSTLPSTKLILKFPSQRSPPNAITISSNCYPSKHKIQPKCSYCLCCLLQTVHISSPSLVHFPMFHLVAFTKGRAGTS
jgi:hypothetical protein